MAFRIGKSVLSILQLVSANVVVKVVGLGMIAFYARYLTKEELSLIPVYAMIGSLAMVFLGFGLRPTLLRLLPAKLVETPDEARGLIYTSSALLFFGATLYMTLCLVFAPQLSQMLFKTDETVYLMRIVAVGAFFTSARDITNYLLWTGSRFDKISLVQTSAALLRAALGASFVLLWGIDGLAFALVVADLFGFLLSLVFLGDFFQKRGVAWFPPLRLLRMSLPFYLESFLIYFRTKGDSWIIATSLGPSALAVYFVAKRLPQLLTMIRGSIDNVLTTQISKKANRPDEISEYVPRLYELMSHTVMPLILLLAGITPATVLLVAGAEYAEAIVPAIILCWAQLAQMFAAPAGRAIFVTRHPLVRVLATTGESLALVVGLVVLAPWLQETGVALSLLFAGIAAVAIGMYLLSRTMSFDFPTDQFVRSLVASSLMMVTLLGLQYRGITYVAMPLVGLAGLLVFAIVVSVTNSERFYGTLNTVSPVRLIDPVRWVLRRGRTT